MDSRPYVGEAAIGESPADIERLIADLHDDADALGAHIANCLVCAGCGQDGSPRCADAAAHRTRFDQTEETLKALLFD